MYRVVDIHPLDLGLDNVIFTTEELALGTARMRYAERNLFRHFGDFEDALKTHISVVRVVVMEEKK